MAKKEQENKSLWERVFGSNKDNDNNFRDPKAITGMLGTIGRSLSGFRSSVKNKQRYFGIVVGAITAIADSFSASEVKLYRRKKDGEIEVVENHKALDFLRKPNSFMASTDLKTNWASNMNIAGNVYWAFICF